MKGMTTCKICGRDFPLMAEEHYIARDPQRVGVLANLTDTDKAMEYDAFDCPHCGCQNVMQVRKSLWIPEKCDEEEESKESKDHNGCMGCLYENKTCDEYPCSVCKYNHADMYEKKED